MAFVIFRSMEGRQRALSAFNKDRSLLKDAKWALCPCLRPYAQRKLLFMGKYRLTVKEAPSASLIHWLNLGVSTFARICFMLLNFIISFALLCGSTYVIVWFSYRYEEITERSALRKVAITKTVTLLQALADHKIADPSKRQGLMEAYCEQQKAQGVGIESLVFPENKNHCLEIEKEKR